MGQEHRAFSKVHLAPGSVWFRPGSRAGSSTWEAVWMTDGVCVHLLVHLTVIDLTWPHVCAGLEARNPQVYEIEGHLLSWLSL